MAKSRVGQVSDYTDQLALLASLSDDLALPLLQIKSSLEVLDSGRSSSKDNLTHLASMRLASETGLQLVEAFRLAINADNAQLPLTPVSVGAILQEVAHGLTPYAKQYNTVVRVDVQPRLSPVLAHKPSLAAAMQCLGASLIRAQAASNEKKSYQIMFGAHKNPDNVITTGAFSAVVGLSDKALRSARALAGHARQPLNVLPAGAAGGILVADILCAAMWQPLRSAAHRNLQGLATAVPISKQLNLV
ncbi:hypothetical protein A3A68_01935 [Candidatus Saccharibacteria bacterium RIFCSPLOWO2_01_FULL_48_13]|nr:MAG: hypothetical protein A3F38_02545 [Candidatus Saccharibacteria bacterium RIFCSPHIGHO2_12_FULL_48_21]OGL36624.1 MAG: hypothetical protein A3A68_01935 [Candidatus Saccharibacteria bacterium RIFCSPLOWO2_01_FULL_48_13]